MVDRIAIVEKVKSIVSSRFGVPMHEIDTSKLLVEDFGADSRDIVELVLQLEDAFHFETPDDDAERLRTVGDIVDTIVKYHD